MRKNNLLFLSVIISSLALLYLLFINVYNHTFIIRDWIVVTVDLLAKMIIELIILFGKD
ncbi:MAG TPA: hypothetical protein VJA23_00570 [Candidatus Nanoarchaeia archaeon]|nr:hypothetical protein [Candidatus Nanoarchaeia archaeon]